MSYVLADVHTALAGWRSASERDRLLQVVQPGLIGLIDGTISTLAPIFASAYVAGSRAALLVGFAAALARRSAWACPRRSPTTARSPDAAARSSAGSSPASPPSSAGRSTRCRSS